jgi:hypothetical protein
MESPGAPVLPAEEVLFRDGFGDRLLVRDAAGKPSEERLVLRTELSAVPSFEFSLTERLAQLQAFDHPAFVRVRQLVRLPGHLPRLSLVADSAGGARLSDVLAALEERGATVPAGAAVFVIHEILDGVCALHKQNTGVVHGALAPERVVLNGKIRITDYVLGSAVEQLRFTPDRYWRELRVAVPASAGASRIDRRADVAQLGMIALALFAGRPLHDDEHLGNVSGVLERLTLPDPIRAWLLRMLQLDPRRAYVGSAEAAQGLEEAIREAGVQPAPLVMSALGIRTQRASMAAVVRPAPKIPPMTSAVKKAPPRATKQDPWNARDVESARRSMGHEFGADEHKPSRFGRRLKTILKIGILGASLAGAFTAAQFVPAPAIFSQTGMLEVESNPAGANLLIDGKEQGVTPMTLKLKSGKHEVEVRGEGKPRVFSVYVAAGDHVSQFVELRTPRRNQR